MNFKFMFLATATFFNLSAQNIFAQTTHASTSTIKVEEAKKTTEKVKDIDEEITDARLRAQLGSKSKWSFQSSLAYSGGSIKEPLGSIRPNYRASATMEDMASLSGTVGVNFRATERDNINFGTGIRVVDPLHGDLMQSAQDARSGRAGKELPRYEVSTPYLGWTRGYRVSGTQMVSGISYGHATDSDSVNLVRAIGSLSLSQTLLMSFGSSGWNGGASFSLTKAFYEGPIVDPGMLARINKGTYKRSDYNAGLFPFLQYSFNDRYSFRTVFGYLQIVKYETLDHVTQLEPYQSVGAGIAVSRDIYLYPNIQFTPRDMRPERTNVALSANINVF